MKKQQLTRVKLKESVREMLQKNPMQAINIKSIAAASNISRTSFYANFENLDDLIYELHDDFMNGIGVIYKNQMVSFYQPISGRVLTSTSEYIYNNKSLIQFLLHEEGLELFIERTCLRGTKLIVQYFKMNGIAISQQKRNQLEIILIGCVHSIYHHLSQCKVEDINKTLKYAYNLFFDSVFDKAS